MQLALPIWAIAVAAGGGALLLLLVVTLIIYCRRRSRRRQTRLTGDPTTDDLPALGQMVIRRGKMVPANWKWSLGASVMLGDKASRSRSSFTNMDDAQRTRSRSRSPFSLLSRYDRPKTPQSPGWPSHISEKSGPAWSNYYGDGEKRTSTAAATIADKDSIALQAPTLSVSHAGSRGSVYSRPDRPISLDKRTISDDGMSKKTHWSITSARTPITEEDEFPAVGVEPLKTPSKAYTNPYRNRPISTKLALPKSTYAMTVNSRSSSGTTLRSPVGAGPRSPLAPPSPTSPHNATPRLDDRKGSDGSQRTLVTDTRSRPSTPDKYKTASRPQSSSARTDPSPSVPTSPRHPGTPTRNFSRNSYVPPLPSGMTTTSRPGTSGTDSAPRFTEPTSYPTASTPTVISSTTSASAMHFPLPPPPPIPPTYPKPISSNFNRTSIPQTVTTISATNSLSKSGSMKSHKYNKSLDKKLPELPGEEGNGLSRSGSKKGNVLRKKSLTRRERNEMERI